MRIGRLSCFSVLGWRPVARRPGSVWPSGRRSAAAGHRAVRRRRRHRRAQLSAARQPAVRPPRLQRPQLPRQLPGPRRLSPVAVRLRLQGRSRGAAEGRSAQRANNDKPLESLILVKPTDADMHEGGQRYKKGGWEYHVFRRWLEAGAKSERKGRAEDRQSGSDARRDPLQPAGRESAAQGRRRLARWHARRRHLPLPLHAATATRSPRSTPTAW